MGQKMIVKPAKNNIKNISLFNHSTKLIYYTIVRPSIFFYTAAQTIVLKCPIFTRSYIIISNLNNWVKHKMSEKNITVKILDTQALIEDACALLYKEYIETGSWVFSDKNPSELKVITKNNRGLLVDRITPHAIWFGAFDADKIVGCIRIFKATRDIPLEIETYPTAQEIGVL